ncbi:MAG: hypothetical protein RL722_1171, partial [Pseudomonadota bacterium]
MLLFPHLRRDRGLDHAVPSEITPLAVYQQRRRWLAQGSALLAGAVAGPLAGTG